MKPETISIIEREFIDKDVKAAGLTVLQLTPSAANELMDQLAMRLAAWKTRTIEAEKQRDEAKKQLFDKTITEKSIPYLAEGYTTKQAKALAYCARSDFYYLKKLFDTGKCYYVEAGGRRKKQREHDLAAILQKFDIKFSKGNDAPRGGRLGDWIKTRQKKGATEAAPESKSQLGDAISEKNLINPEPLLINRSDAGTSTIVEIMTNVQKQF